MASGVATAITRSQNSQAQASNNFSNNFTNRLAIHDALEDEPLRSHPLGVRPSGNALTSQINLASSMGILGRIPDALLLLLLEFLDGLSLLALGETCKGLFAYATHDQLWRDLTLRELDEALIWRGTWRSSFLKRSVPLPEVDCRGLYSDALYRPFQCTYSSFKPFVTNIPQRNQIDTFADLNNDEFQKTWSDKPFILTEPVKRWQVYQDWNEEKLLEKYGDVKFRAEAVDWPLRSYVDYMNHNQDESPLYLFDRAFVKKMQLAVGPDGAYEPPPCFQEDLFTLLGSNRPDHRWLIIGPERSGSTFHKDPNATSAWNAVLRGSKYWIMFPNSTTPPGVYVSNDQSEVTSPLSIGEWLLSFHDEARQIPGCVEGICGPGEVLHVPSGWWHLVVNLEPAIAITQNFVPRSHLMSAVNFLKNKPEQVSGFRKSVQDPFALFVERLQEHHPDLYEIVQSRNQNKRKWDDVVAPEDTSESKRGGFSFGFGNDSDLEEE